MVTTIDSAAVARAAGALEGTAALCDDMDESMSVPISLTVGELRNFVHYMRTLDKTAREYATAGSEVAGMRKELGQYVQRIKLLEKALESKGSETPEKAGPEGEPIVTSLWNRARKATRRKTAAKRNGPKGCGDPVRSEE